MSDDKLAVVGFAICAVVLWGTCSTARDVGRSFERDDWKEWSVDTGRAEFYLDDKHEKQWRWKEQP